MDKVDSFRTKLALMAIAAAVCLAGVGLFYPLMEIRSFVWGAAVGLVAAAFFLIMRNRDPIAPEQARQNVSSSRKWIHLSAGMGPVLVGTTLAVFAPNIGWFVIGFALGMIIVPGVLITQAMLQPSKPKPRDQQFPLEPKR